MPAEPQDFPALAERFRRLPAADRRAVLARFSPAERRMFERRLAAEIEERHLRLAEERRAELQFSSYSPALAGKVERAVRGERAGELQLTEACAAALARAHSAISSPPGDAGLAGLLRKLPWLLPLFFHGARR